MTRIITLIFSMIFSVAMIAQNGVLTIELVDASSTDAQTAAQLEMTKGTQMKVSYINKKSLTEITSMGGLINICLLYTSPSPRDRTRSRMPSSA